MTARDESKFWDMLVEEEEKGWVEQLRREGFSDLTLTYYEALAVLRNAERCLGRELKPGEDLKGVLVPEDYDVKHEVSILTRF